MDAIIKALKVASPEKVRAFKAELRTAIAKGGDPLGRGKLLLSEIEKLGK